MKKIMTFVVVGTLLIFGVTAYFVYINVIDTIYAANYAKCFSNYDITQVDNFLDTSTLITYKGTTKKYGELRENVISALQNKQFIMTDDSSYGHGDGFSKGIQEVGIENFVEIDGKTREIYIEMTIKQSGIINFSIESLSSNDDFFGYLFFREPLLVE